MRFTVKAMNLTAYALVALGLFLFTWGYEEIPTRLGGVIFLVIAGVWLKIDAYTLNPNDAVLSQGVFNLLIWSALSLVASILIVGLGNEKALGYIENHLLLTILLSCSLLILGIILLWLAVARMKRESVTDLSDGSEQS